MEFVQPIREIQQIDAMKKILRANPNGLRDVCWFVVGLHSGLRVSDLLALRVADVLDERGRPRDRLALREKKTGKLKTFPLGPQAQKCLRDYLADRFGKGTTPDRAAPLFASRKGDQALQRAQVYRLLRAAATAVGIKDRVGTHTMRKTFGFHLYQRGVDVTRIQKLLNHSAPSVTLSYLGITQDELDEIYLSLDF